MAPSKSEIEALFKNLETGNAAAFMEHVSPNVDWTVMGTHPCAGHYKSLKDFQQATFARLGAIMKEPGIRLFIRNVIGGGREEDWATVEMVADAECKNGFNFENTYAWCCRFDENGTIVQIRAYLDSWMVKQAIEENECGSHRAPVPKLGD